jgi:RNA polymerase sigma factor (sigma-70 family)
METRSGLDPERRARDVEMAARCAASPPERRSWEEFYSAYAPAVRAWLRQGYRLNDDSAIEDMLQKVFLLCAQGALARYRGETSLKSYLFTIADRVRISENRRLSRQCRDVRRSISMDAAVTDGESATLAASLAVHHSLPHRLGIWRSQRQAQPDQLYQQRLVAHRLQSLCADLSDPRDREIVRRYFWEGTPDREIGEALQLPTNTVTWRRHRVLALLRRKYHRLATQTPAAVPATPRRVGRPTATLEVCS